MKIKIKIYYNGIMIGFYPVNISDEDFSRVTPDTRMLLCKRITTQILEEFDRIPYDNSKVELTISDIQAKNYKTYDEK